MIDWQRNPDYAAGQAGAAFASLDAVFELQGERVTIDPESEVIRLRCDGILYYVKRYTIGRRKLARRWFGLRDIFGPQRAVKEWRNLQRFHAWGLPTATLVAWGQERQGGRFVRAALVTEELRDTVDLSKLYYDADPRLRDARWVAAVSTQVAACTRAMHAHGFVHNDLKWRNLLVTNGETPQLYLIDCPNGGFWMQPFLGYRIVKDLACLDKVAKCALSRTQRLRFYLDYAGRSRLTAADKRKIRKILDFFAGRE
ncbi:lipopolysaccharide kinase InaA family protein [Azonexus sp.]|uniref:lipopolysaccharide kinase InaA family protein n=1 Tax=Azonexus sp. TaxID=1872668 RepID=UPI0035B473BB